MKFVAQDLAADVRDLLRSSATLVKWREDGEPEEAPRAVGPGDIGVLVRTNRQAAVVQASLRAAGVPVVVAGALSVLSTPAARDWLRLLEALEQPTKRSLAVAAALTPFIGMSARELAEANEQTWETLHRVFINGRRCFDEAGWPPSSTTSASVSGYRPDCSASSTENGY